ncbi:MAG TPA: bifunctional DNA primase/polymerase [Stellaceae bacterium]|nr:bifunctional DNA primase/polymerase [Stellaceae bacterium]
MSDAEAYAPAWRRPRLVEMKIGDADDFALRYRARGWAVLPLEPKGKDPLRQISRGWQNFVADDSTTFPGNVGVLLGARSDGLVDVDLDCPETVALAAELLPPTDAVFGRAGKRRSHWLYRCEPPPETKQFQFDKAMLCELRSSGGQTMFPPSIHPSGERVEWAGDGEPAEVASDHLLRCVADIAALCLLIRNWPETHGRYNAEGALIGALLRAGRGEDEVERIVDLMQRHAGKSRKHPPGKSVPRLAGKLAEGKPVPGLNRLKELLGADVAGRVAEWMSLGRRGAQPYEERDGAICWMQRKDDKVTPVRLCNFTAAIAEVVKRDDGSDLVERRFVVRGSRGSVEVPAEEFDAMSWVTSAWGPWASIVPGPMIRPHLAEAIKSFSDEAEERTIYAHLGWRNIDGRWLYLHAGGAIGADGPAEGYEVDPGGKLAHYKLPPVRDLAAAIRASLSMRRLGAAGFVALAAVYRAPLVEFCEVTTSVYIEGKTGAFKSAIEGVALSHWGAQWDGVQFPANWTGTANALEKLAFLAKDALFVVDDFKPPDSARDSEKLHQTADRFLRAAANLGGRDRMNADSTLRETYHPRGLVMSSGEDVPKGQSLRARMVIHHMEKEDIDVAALSDLQKAAAQGLLAEAMAGYVQWIARRGADEMRDACATYVAERRAELAGEHARTPHNIASLLLGIEQLALFAQESGALSEADVAILRREARAAIVGEAERQDNEQAAEDPARRFISLIGEALAAGRAHVDDRRDGEAPRGIELECGWRKRKYHSADGREGEAWQPQGDRIGWIDGDFIYLNGAASYAVAERLSRDQNRSIGITLDTLGKRLLEARLIADTKQKPIRSRDGVNRTHRLDAAAVLHRREAPTYSEKVQALRRAIVAVEGHAKTDMAKAAVAELLKQCDELWDDATDNPF